MRFLAAGDFSMIFCGKVAGNTLAVLARHFCKKALKRRAAGSALYPFRAT